MIGLFVRRPMWPSSGIFNFVIVLSFFPPFKETLWSMLGGCCHWPWNQTIQSITVPLSDHIQPHPLSPLDIPPPFLLFSSHWWVESVDYHCDEDISGAKWEASARKSPVEEVSSDLHAARGRAAVGGQRAVGAFHLGQPEGGKEKPFTCDLNCPKHGHQCKQTTSSTPLDLLWFPRIHWDQPRSQFRTKPKESGLPSNFNKCCTQTNLNQAHTEHPVVEIWKKSSKNPLVEDHVHVLIYKLGYLLKCQHLHWAKKRPVSEW